MNKHLDATESEEIEIIADTLIALGDVMMSSDINSDFECGTVIGLGVMVHESAKKIKEAVRISDD